MKSLVITVPVEFQQQANRIAVALGHDSSPLPGQTFSVGYSGDGNSPATHYSARTQADEAFISLLSNAFVGNVPPEAPGGSWEDYGLTPETIIEAVGSLLFDIRTENELTSANMSYGDHLSQANAGWGLYLVNQDN